ncbi:hypothetical protein J3L16_00235 [Alteromonas sp. 5E99-2]|uniref:hypothetical protein n=1 Tax=Alteromonas sp. 5E99-2 TaxID=2817683 RepID=UPI001A9A1299|nr:hypothetical protein [Alteromonas sp. 5E99-2]MBO1254104.1 hypothetical protein [Alteromonas sp. 5E99-2]
MKFERSYKQLVWEMVVLGIIFIMSAYVVVDIIVNGIGTYKSKAVLSFVLVFLVPIMIATRLLKAKQTEDHTLFVSDTSISFGSPDISHTASWCDLDSIFFDLRLQKLHFQFKKGKTGVAMFPELNIREYDISKTQTIELLEQYSSAHSFDFEME